MTVTKVTNSFKRIPIRCPVEKFNIKKAVGLLTPIFTTLEEGFTEEHYDIDGTIYSIISKDKNNTIIELLV